MLNKDEKTSLKEVVQNLPGQPGIYKYFNFEGTILYVGKAKNIKKRVSSYFTKASTDAKTRSLVNQIASIEFIVVNSETDALLLENNLIKEHHPKYNILLKDDKTFPYILVTNDRFPKIYATRKINPVKGEYFGPFSSVGAMNTVLELIKKLFTIRNCDLSLAEISIRKQKFKKCLEYHLGNCKAPCEALQSVDEYLRDIEQVKLVLDGDLSIVHKYFKEKMKFYAENLDYENAQKIKWKIELLEKFQSYSIIVNTNFKDQVVATFNYNEKTSFLNLIKISFGRIVLSKTIEIINQLDETADEIFSAALSQIITNQSILTKEILTNINVELAGLDIKTSVPLIGEKKKLIDLSLKNIEFYKRSKRTNEEKELPYQRVLETLKQELSLKDLPTHIECFDNSNTQGTDPVAAMVCFKNGLPFKSEWRHFNIKTVIGPNDYDSMAEIIYRRYSRLQIEEKPMPNLIIVDGGKGQLSAAIKSLEKLGLYGKIPIVSIAKRLEEIYTPNDDLPLMLKKNSESLRLIQRIRDEVHRFGITFHRKKRDTIKKEK